MVPAANQRLRDYKKNNQAGDVHFPSSVYPQQKTALEQKCKNLTDVLIGENAQGTAFLASKKQGPPHITLCHGS